MRYAITIVLGLLLLAVAIRYASAQLMLGFNTGSGAGPVVIPPTLPQGIYHLNDVGSTTEPTSAIINLSYVDGATVRVRWSDLETSEGSYTWTTFDSPLTLIQAANKLAQIIFFTGQKTPCWVVNAMSGDANGGLYVPTGNTPNLATLQASCLANPTQPISAEDSSGNIVPLPWDTIYQAKLGAMITAMAAHATAQGTMPIITGVMAAGIASNTAETRLCSTGAGGTCATDTTGWNAVGYTHALVQGAFKTFLNDWATAFPNIGLRASFTFDAFPQADLAPGCSGTDSTLPRLLTDVGYLNYPKQFIMAYNGLNDTNTVSGGAGPGNLLPQMCPTGRTGTDLWPDCANASENCQGGRDYNTFQGATFAPHVALEGLQECNVEGSACGDAVGNFSTAWNYAQTNFSNLKFIEIYPADFTAANAAALIAAHNALTGNVPTPTPTPTPGPTPAPPTLTNAQIIAPGQVYGGHTIAGNGSTDDTAAIQAALNTNGDLDVKTGVYFIGTSTALAMKSNQKVYCENPLPTTQTAPNGVTVAGNWPLSAPVAFQTVGNQVSSSGIFDMHGTSNNEIYGCQFRGNHFPNLTWPTETAFLFNQALTIHPNFNAPSNFLIANNDFTGWGGVVGAITMDAFSTRPGTSDNQNGVLTPSGINITYNSFRSQNVRGIEWDAGGGTVTHNFFQDSQFEIETQDVGVLTQVHLDSNWFHWVTGANGGNFTTNPYYQDTNVGFYCHNGNTVTCSATNQQDDHTNTASNNVSESSTGVQNEYNEANGNVDFIQPAYRNNACNANCRLSQTPGGGFPNQANFNVWGPGSNQ